MFPRTRKEKCRALIFEIRDSAHPEAELCFGVSRTLRFGPKSTAQIRRMK